MKAAKEAKEAKKASNGADQDIKKSRKSTLFVIVVALLIDLLAFTIILPLFPRLLKFYEVSEPEVFYLVLLLFVLFTLSSSFLYCVWPNYFAATSTFPEIYIINLSGL